MRRQWTGDFAVGLFVLAMLAALIFGIAQLTGRSGHADRYTTVYRNVTDIGFGTKVFYEGYPVGQVEAVTPHPSGSGMEFVVELSVRRGWRIPVGSVATLVSPRMLAPLAIEIRGGTSETALRPGDAIPGEPGQNLFAAVGALAGQLSTVDFAQVDTILASVRGILGDVRELVGSDGKVASAQLADLLSTANRALPPLVADLERLAKSVDATVGDAGRMVGPENREKVESILANADRTSGELQHTAADTRQLMARLDALVERNGDSIEHSSGDARYVLAVLARNMDAIMQNLNESAHNIQEVTRQIRANPGLLIRGTRVEDAAGRP